MPQDSKNSEVPMINASIDKPALNERQKFEIAARIEEMLSPKFIAERLEGKGLYEQHYWVDRMALIAVILAALEKLKGNLMGAKTMADLIQKKPLQNLDIVEYGFGGPRQEHITALHALGANVFGVEPNQPNVQSVGEAVSNMVASGQISLDTSQIQRGFASQIPTLFPGQKFDVIASSRTMESYPMSEDFAIDILSKTRRSLKEGGFSIHTTTDPFIPNNNNQIQQLGYEVIVLNTNFENKRSAGVHKYTILRKGAD